MCIQSYCWLKFRSSARYHLLTPPSSRKLISIIVRRKVNYIDSWKYHKTSFLMQEIDWKSDICALKKRDFSMGQEFPWFPQDGKFPKLGKFPYGKFPGGKSLKPYGREGTGISRWTSLGYQMGCCMIKTHASQQTSGVSSGSCWEAGQSFHQPFTHRLMGKLRECIAPLSRPSDACWLREICLKSSGVNCWLMLSLPINSAIAESTG